MNLYIIVSKYFSRESCQLNIKENLTIEDCKQSSKWQNGRECSRVFGTPTAKNDEK